MRDDILWAIRHVLADPVRLQFLFADGLATPFDLTLFLRTIVPLAERELAQTRRLADVIPDDRLREEALASIDGKAYHVAGASILATFLPDAAAHHYVRIVAPLESIYDYLDNLCDRHPDVAPDAYPILHQAIADALDPNATPRAYYARGPIGDDGDYLHMLVRRTQRELRRLADHDLLLAHFREAASFYAEMQTFKHYAQGEREHLLIEWYHRHRERFATLTWHEFACAAGSQFQVYAPLYAAFAGHFNTIDRVYDAYFPYVSALHVLLDSFIDQREDSEHHELNFATVYGGREELLARAAFLARNANERFGFLRDANVHRFVLRIMILFYLTHPKIEAQGLDTEARALLRALG